jgi:hypothetical protein
MNLDPNFVVNNASRIQLAMAALIIVGVVRTWDWSDSRNANNNAIFDFYSVQELV